MLAFAQLLLTDGGSVDSLTCSLVASYNLDGRRLALVRLDNGTERKLPATEPLLCVVAGDPRPDALSRREILPLKLLYAGQRQSLFLETEIPDAESLQVGIPQHPGSLRAKDFPVLWSPPIPAPPAVTLISEDSATVVVHRLDRRFQDIEWRTEFKFHEAHGRIWSFIQPDSGQQWFQSIIVNAISAKVRRDSFPRLGR